MPDGIAIHSFITEPGSDRILVRHTFYGRTAADADKLRDQHIAGCENFAAAEDDDRVIELIEDGVSAPIAADLRIIEEEQYPGDEDDDDEPEEDDEDLDEPDEDDDQ